MAQSQTHSRCKISANSIELKQTDLPKTGVVGCPRKKSEAQLKGKLKENFGNRARGKKKFEKYNVSLMKLFIHLNLVLEELIQQRKEQR